MKRRSIRKQKLAKGMPSAVLLSILIHAGLFLLAGALVVFTVVKKEEKKFEPPQTVERPKIKLKKPKVKLKKTARPKATSRIVTKVNRASMPDIQLPEMSGVGEGFSGDLGGFDMMPELDDASLFGNGQSIGNDFIGTFYDFLRDRNGRRVELSKDLPEFLRGFVKSGWEESYFSRYYRSPQKLYATTCMFPCIQSIVARVAYNEFEEGHEPNDYYWAIHYKGKLVHKDGIKFRFWGMGSSFLIVRVDGKTVLDAPLKPNDGRSTLDPAWSTRSADSYKYWIGNGLLTVGDWITLEPGVPLDMEYLFADWGGGEFSANLLVEVEGVEYPKNRQNGPILPIFKTANLSFDQLDRIMEFLVYDSACLTNGPVFCDYDPTPINLKADTPSGSMPEPSPPEPREDMIRTWTFADGRNFDAILKTSLYGLCGFGKRTGGTRKDFAVRAF